MRKRAEIPEGTSGIRRTACKLDDFLGPDHLSRLGLSSFGEPGPNPTVQKEKDGEAEKLCAWSFPDRPCENLPKQGSH